MVNAVGSMGGFPQIYITSHGSDRWNFPLYDWGQSGDSVESLTGGRATFRLLHIF
jgi:hypothetical protein